VSGTPIQGALPFTDIKVYRDGVQVGTAQTDENGSFFWRDQSCDLVVGVEYAYHYTYVTTAESLPSPVAPITLTPAVLDCPTVATCDGDDCVGGITAFTRIVEDEATPLTVTVTSLAPGLSVQLEGTTNPTARYWAAIGDPITVGDSPGCANGDVLYEVTASRAVPDEVWQPGLAGSFATVRARTVGSQAKAAKIYGDWPLCQGTNPALTPSELFASCQSSTMPKPMITEAYQGVTATTSPPFVTDLDCRRVSLGGTVGKTVFVDGYPVGGYGASAVSIGNLLPGETYEIRAAHYIDGAHGPVSAPVEVTSPDCQEPVHLTDGDFNLGVHLVVFQGVTAPLPYTAEEFRDWVFNDEDSFSAYVEELSRGTTTVSGDVIGWTTFTGNIADYCNVVHADGTGTQCASPYMDIKAFLGPRQFEHRAIVVFGTDRSSAIGVSGESALGPANRSHPIGILSHESFGHGLLGPEHSASIRCPNGFPPLGLVFAEAQGCQTYPLGDRTEPISGSSGRYYSAYNLWRYGFLSASDLEHATDVEGDSSEHWVGTLTSAVYPVKELRVRLERGGILSLEYRNQTGFNGPPCTSCDPPLNRGASAPTGAQIRLHSPVLLSDWETGFSSSSFVPYQYQDDYGTPVVLNLDNPVLDVLGVRLEVLAQDAEGIRIRVQQ
jgi:hypothetical protein